MAKITIDVDFQDGKTAAKTANELAKALGTAAKGQDALAKETKDATKAFKGFGTVVSGVLTADLIKTGFKTIISGVQALTTDFAKLGDTTAKTADKLGVSVEGLQELRFAAEQSGVGANSLDIGLQRLTRRAAEAAGGTGVAKDAFEQLGIQLKDNQGNVRQTEEIFGDLAGAFGGVESQSEKVRLAFQLFDTEGVALVNLLNQGEEGLDKFSERAQELGLVIGEDAARAAERFSDAQNELNQAFVGVRNTIGSALLPALTDLIKGTVDLFIANKQLIGDVLLALPGIFRKAAIAGALFIAVFKGGEIVSFATKAIPALIGSLKATGAAFTTAKVLATAFKATLTFGLSLAIDFLITKFLEIQDQVGSFENVMTVVGNNIKIAFNEVRLSISELSGGFKGLLLAALPFTRLLGVTAEQAKMLRAENDALTASNQALADANEEGANRSLAADTKLTDGMIANKQRGTEALEAAQIAVDEARTAEDEARAIDFQTRLEQDEEFRDLVNELDEETFQESIGKLIAQQSTLQEIRMQAASDRLKQKQKDDVQFLADEKKFGLAIAKVKRFFRDEEVQGVLSANNDLVKLQNSKNKELAAIGKAAAIVQIGISTAVAAMNVFTGFSTIPFVGVALGIVGAAAAVAFGVEQIGQVLSAQDGGMVPRLPGTTPGVDGVAATLAPGELVVPTQNFDEVVSAVAEARGADREDGGGGSSVIELRLTDGLMDFIEAELVERGQLGTSQIQVVGA